MSVSPAAPLEFYNADVCPFGQRSYITLLEKESDVNKPKLFSYREVSLVNKERPENGDWLKINPGGLVPTARHNSNNLFESLLLDEYIDDVFPQNPLRPADAYGKFYNRLLIERHGNSLTGAIFKVLGDHSQSSIDGYFTAVKNVQKDIQGPFLVGDQFTLADIALFPFFERAIAAFEKFVPKANIPQTEEYAKFWAWYKAVSERPSVKVTTGDRTEASLKIQPYGARTRKEYLQEVFTGYAYGVPRPAITALLKNAPAGVTTMTEEKAKELAAKAREEEELKKQTAQA